MPDSGAVYQPTTVGYTYDTGGNGAGSGGGLRHNFWRIISRHKVNSRKWTEWVLILGAFCLFTTGLTMMIVSLLATDESKENDMSQATDSVQSTTMQTETPEHVNDDTNCIALGASMMLLGLLLGCVWAWLRFFRRSKSPRNGMTGSSGQMLGGLNPSTDLLVGSTSQYGPVLTELPSQIKVKQSNSHETPVAPLSDQEEETHTLMQDSTVPLTISGDANTVANQIPG